MDMTLKSAAAMAARPLAAATARRVAAVVVLAVSLVMAAPDGGPAAAEDSQVTHFTLANGLEVVVIPDHRTPVVTHTIWYRVGSADEPAGKSGLAHFLEHLMFKGTVKNPAGRFSQWVNAIGGQENASTSSDYTVYYQRVARQYLATAMAFEADRMTGLALTDDDVLRERDVVLEEFNMTIGNSPESRLGVQVNAALYLNHPYGRPVIGWRHEIEQLSREDALAFYRRFYAPNNAIVVLAGDVAPDDVRALVDRTYGQLARGAQSKPRARPQEPVPEAMRQLTMADDRVIQPSLQRRYLVPSWAAAAPGEGETLEALARVLGGGETSRLYRTLVVDRHLAAVASSEYIGMTLDESTLSVSATALPGVTLATLEAAIDEVIAGIADHGVTAAELDAARTGLIADLVYEQDSQAAVADWYGGCLVTGVTIAVASLSSWTARLEAVTGADLQHAARRWLDQRRSVTGYLVKRLPGLPETHS